ncbi:ras-related protein Rab-20 isoform X2 [Mustela nigripes]|uniref:ras-related protein Rab-20 isoform X2 n=1 Tax=Mustela nigripes TaxID=77151 RepID=UPI0028169D5D|nr:ras-related protein Rab-20 isoform X2 [Mustela nigripes]
MTQPQPWAPALEAWLFSNQAVFPFFPLARHMKIRSFLEEDSACLKHWSRAAGYKEVFFFFFLIYFSFEPTLFSAEGVCVLEGEAAEFHVCRSGRIPGHSRSRIRTSTDSPRRFLQTEHQTARRAFRQRPGPTGKGRRGFAGSAATDKGREQFHGLGSLYCRGAAAVILTYDVSHPQSLLELEDRFLGLTDTASTDCLFAVVGNKMDLVEEGAAEGREEDGPGPGTAGSGRSPKVPKLVQPEDAVALYRKILKYKMLDEKAVPAAEQMCFETSAKTGYNVDLLFETLFDMVVPLILRQRAQGPPQTVDISSRKTPRQTRSGCCA